jgi:hypothetical protein
VTIGELLIASAITITLMATVLGMTRPLQHLFDTQPAYADVNQRLRAGVDALAKDLLAAAAPVMPYRAGARRHDPAAGVFYRSDAITLVPVPWDDPDGRPHTYYLKNDAATGIEHLMRYDGHESDLPVADHVVGLEFVYFGADGMQLSAAALQDGPWFPDALDSHRFDMDLLKIRRVRVTLRVQPAPVALRRLLPEREIRFDVAPRNLNRE